MTRSTPSYSNGYKLTFGCSYTCGEDDLLLVSSYDRTQWSRNKRKLLLDMVTDANITYQVYSTSDQTIVVGQTNPDLQWLDDAQVMI